MGRVVFVNGCFDLLHAGHVWLLQFARSQGDELVVGLNSDTSVRAIKGPTRPIIPQQHRQFILESLKCVTTVIVFDERTPDRLICEVKPDVYVIGSEYSSPYEDCSIPYTLMRVVRCPPGPYGVHTSEIIQQIRRRW